MISALLQSGLVMDGGIVTTLNNNTQQWDFPNAWAPLQWMIVQGIETSVYESTSTIDNFVIYNSTNLSSSDLTSSSSTPTPPPHGCDIVHPESWYTCTPAGTLDCVWCFPNGPDLSKALGLRWLTSNFLAYDSTGYMLEKYFAPEMGSPGAGGEYKLQKGFGWTNGVALHFLTSYAQDSQHLNLTYLLEQSYPYSKMAPYVDTSPLVPDHPPNTISSQPIAKMAQQVARGYNTLADNTPRQGVRDI